MRPLRLSSMNLIVYEGLSLTAIVWERSDCRYRLTTTQLTRNGRHSFGKSEPKKFMGADGTVIQLYDDLIACGDEQHKLDGVHASVEDSSAFESRVTSIRMLAVGLLAFAFQKSGGEKYLTVESPTLRGQPQLIVSRYLTRWDLRPLLMILRENCCGYAKKADIQPSQIRIDAEATPIQGWCIWHDGIEWGFRGWTNLSCNRVLSKKERTRILIER